MDADDRWDHSTIAELRRIDQALDEQDADDEAFFAARDVAVVELTEHRQEWEHFLKVLDAI